MSFSVCIKCRQQVPAYEKYCDSCIKKYFLFQDRFFHKRTGLNISDYEAEFQKDLEKTKPLKRSFDDAFRLRVR